MEIAVYLHAALRTAVPAESQTRGCRVLVPPGATLSTLLHVLGIARPFEGRLTVNGHHDSVRNPSYIMGMRLR